jgi:RNA polymerase sigma-70 factor (ECF subfamily)
MICFTLRYEAPMPPPERDVTQAVNAIWAQESRRVFATLVRLLGDFTRAEEALQDAFAAALVQWPRDGIPVRPRAWLVSTGRFKAIDALRREARFDTPLDAIADRLESDSPDPAELAELADDDLEDDRLRLIFTCCHPALAPEQRVALTLREVCGLTTEAIASAFLIATPAVAQRIVRAKAKIRDAGIPYRVPEAAELPERLDAALQVVYLLYNEGYSASSGEQLRRPDLTAEAIRLAELLVELLPAEPEATGLLALMLLQESRRETRTDDAGELVLLELQDRDRWDHAMIQRGSALVEASLRSGSFGAYALQAAIAAVHAEAPTAAATDWSEIVGLYDALLALAPGPVVELNRAVAVGMRDGPASGLDLIDRLIGHERLRDYHLAHAARADLCRRLGRVDEAVVAYRKAAGLARQEPERRFLERRIRELTGS